ncbi:Cytochrome b [Allochromatium warmingii]|uniref:Cytochrome b n=1 Tax=Allochromatium warmingii TaxID=61595 RepID=A0A1H3IPP6_ALLWA|nr:cytochrome b/b6 domain-containing protein [Allochromatium warmingii]SDY29682.1 Cytochrome b [Allochromatium warmingii]
MHTNTDTHLDPTASDTTHASERIRVWDPLIRLFHWSLVAGFATAFIVEDDNLSLHVWAGYLVLALISGRLVWGVIGTRQARFSDFVRRPRAVWAYLGAVIQRRAPRYLGHNPAGGAMIVLLLISLIATTISGLALYGAEELAGPLAEVMRSFPAIWGDALEDIHELFANLTLGLILIHVAGVLVSSLLHRENLIGAMLHGYKRKE